MTDKVVAGGWVVSVTTQCGRKRQAEFYEVAEAAPIGAEHAVSMHIDAMHEKIEAVERIPRAIIEGLGLRPGDVRKRA
jgi:hypothetical protein